MSALPMPVKPTARPTIAPAIPSSIRGCTAGACVISTKFIKPMNLLSDPPRPSRSLTRDRAGAAVTVLGGALTCLGTFLPWASGISSQRNAFELGPRGGFSTGGAALVLLGMLTVALGVGLARQADLPLLVRRSPVLAGAASLVVPLTQLGPAAWVGLGCWIALSAGAVTLAGGLLPASAASPEEPGCPPESGGRPVTRSPGADRPPGPGISG